MAPQNGTTTDDENGDAIGVIGFFRHTHLTYPDLGNNASVGDLNSLRWQEATPENSERTEPGWRSERSPEEALFPREDTYFQDRIVTLLHTDQYAIRDFRIISCRHVSQTETPGNLADRSPTLPAAAITLQYRAITRWM